MQSTLSMDHKITLLTLGLCTAGCDATSPPYALLETADAGDAAVDADAMTAPPSDAGPPSNALSTAFNPGEAEFSAAVFIEAYCSGCHQPQFKSPSGRPVSIFCTDPAWRHPFGNPGWLDQLDYAKVVEKSDLIRCGVYPNVLPEACLYLPDAPPGFFNKAEKFPPSGIPSGTGYGTTPPPVCAFAGDGHTCPQPSEFERVGMVSWIDSGMAR
jgi:hypothetical protein